MFKFKVRRKLQADYQALLDETLRVLPECYEEVYALMNAHNLEGASEVVEAALTSSPAIDGDDKRTWELDTEIGAMLQANFQPRLKLVISWRNKPYEYGDPSSVSVLLQKFDMKFEKRT